MALELPAASFAEIAARLDHVERREDRSAEALAAYAGEHPRMPLFETVKDARADANAVAAARDFFRTLAAREDDVRSLLAGLFAGVGNVCWSEVPTERKGSQ